MSKTKHTPGPWIADGELVRAASEDGEPIVCEMHHWDEATPMEENAYLIAVASEMLNVLESLLKQLENYTASTFTEATLSNMTFAARVIAKAKGGAK